MPCGADVKAQKGDCRQGVGLYRGLSAGGAAQHIAWLGVNMKAPKGAQDAVVPAVPARGLRAQNGSLPGHATATPDSLQSGVKIQPIVSNPNSPLSAPDHRVLTDPSGPRKRTRPGSEQGPAGDSFWGLLPKPSFQDGPRGEKQLSH